jgi:transposase
MTVPGVNVIVPATFLAAVGDVRRFQTSRQLVGYLGLDPRVRQSGSAPATHGRISKQGSASARTESASDLRTARIKRAVSPLERSPLFQPAHKRMHLRGIDGHASCGF